MASLRGQCKPRPVWLVKPETDRRDFFMAPPLGILYMAAALERSGHEVRLVHERFTPEVEERIVREIVAADPLLVGISTFTGPSLQPSLNLTRRIKASSSAPVVWGGLHATMLPEQTLEEDAIDLAVRGEGEETVVRLAELLSAGQGTTERFRQVPGLVFRDGSRIQVNAPPPFIENLDAYPPAWHLLGEERYMGKERSIYTDMGSRMGELKIATIMTSRGCPWRCGYCYNQFVNQRTFRAHSVEFVAAQIARLKREHGVTGIVFDDDCLFTDPRRALAILKQVGLPWTSSIRADQLVRGGDDFIRELKEADCAELRIGAESGSQETLDIMHKDIRREHIVRAAELCLRHDINVIMGFMIGVPGERWSETLKTFDIIDEMEGRGVNVAAGPSFYFPYPGTPMFAAAVKGGFVPPASIEAWAMPWGPSQPLPPYADPRARYAGYFRSLAIGRAAPTRSFPLLSRMLRGLARWRWRHRFFSFPVDYRIPRWVMLGLRKIGLGKYAMGTHEN